MTEFILAYHGGRRPATKEEGQAHMAKWMAWIKGMGGAVVNPGMFLGQSKTVSGEGVADDGGSNPLAGITVLQAETMDAVLELVKTSPHMDLGGTIEVAEVMQM